MEHSSKWNPHIIIKMEYSSKWNTHQNGTLILLSKWNTHQNGTLIKMEHSSKWNTHIKMEHSSKWNTHQKGTLISKWNSSKWNTHQKWNSLNRNIHIIKKKKELILIMEWEPSYQKHCRQPETIKEPSICSCGLLACRLGRASHPPIPCTRLSFLGFVPSGLGFRSNGTLIIRKPWIIAKSLGSSFNDLLKTIKTNFNHITVSFSLTQGSPPPPNLDFGLCARVFSTVFLPLESAIPFSHSPAVSPFKSRDFRLPEPAIPFYPWSAVSHPKSRDFRLPEPTIPFSTWSAVSHPKPRDFRLPEPTIPFSYWSAVSPPTSGHDVTRPIRSQYGAHTSPLYYCRFIRKYFMSSVKNFLFSNFSLKNVPFCAE